MTLPDLSSPLHSWSLGMMEQSVESSLRPVIIAAERKNTTNNIDLEKGQAFDISPLEQLARPSSRRSSFFSKFSTPLPPKHHLRFVRHARHTFLNVYRRLFSLVFIFNLISLWIYIARYEHYSSTAWVANMANAAAANIMVALLIRQDYIVNILFRMTWIVPHKAPLRLRRILAKVYELGGVHSGAAVSSIVWFGLFTGFLTRDLIDFSLANWNVKDPAIISMTYILLFVLILLAITAYPACRFRAHNTFEAIHRWGGWLSLALFWAELVLFVEKNKGESTLGLGMIKLPAFWFLLISSAHTILPWLRLHKLEVTPERLSDHAIRLHFKEKIPLFVGLRVSKTPLGEWHSFAAIPSREGKGGSVIVSNAGDWTKECINNPQDFYWVKGVPVTGVLCMALMFKKIVVVTTGSGIGPVLAVVQDTAAKGCAVRIIWSAAKPVTTFGDGIIDAVKLVDDQAVIIDTRQPGRRRPDLVQIAYDLYKKEDAEAVFCISNPKLTRKIVYGLEGRGVPAFGPVWDS